MTFAAPTRRSLLGAAALLASGCSAGLSPGPREEADPDAGAVARAAEDVERLRGLYTAVIAAHPPLRAGLEPFAAETDAHLDALRAPPEASTASATAGTSITSAAPSQALVVPPDPAAARAVLAGAERDAAARRIGQLSDASPALARLLASIGAAQAAHAALLARPE